MKTFVAFEEATQWAVDPTHSELSFKVKHLMISNVKGEFQSFNITMDSPDGDLENATFAVQIDAASISTNNTDRDEHLRSADFFNVEQFPALTFESQSVKRIDDEEYELNGLMTIRGVSKNITLKMEVGGIMKDPYGNEKMGLSVSGQINRGDYGLTWNAAVGVGEVLVGDLVKLFAEVQLVKQ